MKERLIKFMTAEGLSSAKLADIIKVQPSSISHILSGRNKPGFDFISKILTNFSHLNAEWLIIGEGDMYKQDKKPSLFNTDEKSKTFDDNQDTLEFNISDNSTDEILKMDSKVVNNAVDKNNIPQSINIEKIILFFSDNSFKEYIPNQKN